MTLLLDPSIRDFVVLPLFVMMVSAGLLRFNVMQLLASDKQPIPPIASRCLALQRQAMAIRSGAAHFMTTWQWHVQKQHAITLLQQEADWAEQQEQEEGADANDPMAAMTSNPLSMMKGNMAFMVQNMVMMHFIQQFFSGYILLKVPFRLTVGFKSMFQRGLAELPDLDSSYVSSISWYFLVMYGLRSFFKLVVGEPSLEVKQQEMMQMQQYGLQPQQPPGKNQNAETMAKQLRQEAENLELVQQHTSELDTVEKRLLGKKYPKKSLQTDRHDDILFAGTSKTTSRKTKKKKV